MLFAAEINNANPFIEMFNYFSIIKKFDFGV